MNLYSIPEVAKHVKQRVTQTTVPTRSQENFYLPLWALSFAKTAKNGQYPAGVNMQKHFDNIVDKTYESEREALDLKWTTVKPSCTIPSFSSGFVEPSSLL